MAVILASLVTWLDRPAVRAASGVLPALSGANDSEASMPATPAGETAPVGETHATASLFIHEYRVKGAHLLPRIEVEAAVYPFLGPGRVKEDVEQARAALEQAYRDKGYQTVIVEIPPQQVRGGVVVLNVIEAPVARLRVKGAHYFSPNAIKAAAPSLAEGKVVNFNDVPRDIVALNQNPDRQVTPSLHAGETPGTVDIDLDVKDKLPVHGSLELNNRNGPNTTPLRLNGSLSDNNLWQSGNAAGLSFQISPQNTSQVKVLSGYYLQHFENPDAPSLMFQGTKQDSNVSTLGDTTVAGRGETAGVRLIFQLPAAKDFYDSASFGIDYKHFNQKIRPGASDAGEIDAPVTYYPFTATYSASWSGQGCSTDFDTNVIFHLRGMGSSPSEFDNSRFKADGDFIYLRGDLSHTHDLPAKLQIFGKVQGQIAGQPLLSSEQFTGGGLDTVRGYLEAETVGDNGLCGTLELRSPSLLGWLGRKNGEWRVYVFGDAGRLTLNNPLPEQTSGFDLASYGIGSRVRVQDHFNGSIDAGVPLTTQSETKAHDVRITFRAWAEY